MSTTGAESQPDDGKELDDYNLTDCEINKRLTTKIVTILSKKVIIYT